MKDNKIEKLSSIFISLKIKKKIFKKINIQKNSSNKKPYNPKILKKIAWKIIIKKGKPINLLFSEIGLYPSLKLKLDNWWTNGKYE